MKKFNLNQKENELLFMFGVIILITYGFYALLLLITTSFIPKLVSLIIVLSLIGTIYLTIKYEKEFVLCLKPKKGKNKKKSKVKNIKTNRTLLRI